MNSSLLSMRIATAIFSESDIESIFNLERLINPPVHKFGEAASRVSYCAKRKQGKIGNNLDVVIIRERNEFGKDSLIFLSSVAHSMCGVQGKIPQHSVPWSETFARGWTCS